MLLSWITAAAVLILLNFPLSTLAQEPFLGEIRLWSGTDGGRIPRNWAACNGQILSIAQNTALFSLLGTTYGGDGKSTFALPNLQGRVPIGKGQGPGLFYYEQGDQGGTATVSLIQSQLPSHTHTVRFGQVKGTSNEVGSAYTPCTCPYVPAYSASISNPVFMHANAIGVTGGSQPHNNLMPYAVSPFLSFLTDTNVKSDF